MPYPPNFRGDKILMRNRLFISLEHNFSSSAQGTILTTIGLLGTLLSCTGIYLLLYRRVRLARCQSLFIINLSISDVFVSILGIFRGLGIIDGRFVGAVNSAATPYCAVYILLLDSFGNSNVIALLPLTIDRAVAVIFPLRHGSIINHKTCALMLGSVWASVLITLFKNLIDFKNGTISVEYSELFHRCSFPGKNYKMEKIFLFIIPLMLVLLTYVIMFFIIIKTKRPFGRFILLSTGIVGTNLLSFTPAIVRSFVAYKLSYIASQILFVTVWYLNGIFNPLLYFINHPRSLHFFRSRFSTVESGL